MGIDNNKLNKYVLKINTIKYLNKLEKLSRSLRTSSSACGHRLKLHVKSLLRYILFPAGRTFHVPKVPEDYCVRNVTRIHKVLRYTYIPFILSLYFKGTMPAKVGNFALRP